MNARRSRRTPESYYRDRSSSRERSRTRTYEDDQLSESYHSDYSDDFEPATRNGERSPPRRRRGKSRSRDRRDNYHSSDQNSSISDLHSTSTKKTTQTVGRRTYAKSRRTRAMRSNYSDRKGHVHRHYDGVATRLLSAKQRRINEIQNELAETEQRLESVTKENKLLKTVQHRQDKALRRFENVENDLPRLINQNYEEQKVLKARLKKAQGSEKLLEEKLKENNEEMQKMERTLRKLKKIVYDKNLGERSELARQLSNAESDLSNAERRVKELEKKLDLMTSSYTRQLKSERQKHKETKESLNALVEQNQEVMQKLKEKERALTHNNVYSRRVKESASVKPTPRKSPSQHTKTEKMRDKDEPHEGIKPMMDLTSPKPRKENKRELFKPQIPSPGRSSPTYFAKPSAESPKMQDPEEINGLHSSSKKDTKRQKEHTFLTSSFQSPSPRSAVQDSIEFSRPAIDSDEQASTLRSSSSTVLHLEEDTFVEIEKKKKLEEEERRRKLEEEEEEAHRKKKLEEENKKLAEEQRKKAALLAKMREIEQEDDSPRPPLNSIPVVSAPSKPLLSSEKKSTKPATVVNSEPKSKADRVKLLFGDDTDPVVENLHMGLPTSTKKAVKKPEKELSFGGYAPSAGEAEPVKKQRPTIETAKVLLSESDSDEPLFDLSSGKKSSGNDLMSQLFGDQGNPTKKVDHEQKSGESVTPRAKPVHSGYPWEKNVVTTSQVNGSANHTSKLKIGYQVKASPDPDDDIEELSL